MTDIEKLITAIKNERFAVLTTGENGTIVFHDAHKSIIDAETNAAGLLEKHGKESITISTGNTWTMAELGKFQKK